MNKLNIELTNCFGIDSLKHEFDFGKGNTFSIYARNGLMKTSFAKTFQLIQQGKKENISDAIFGEPGSAIVQIDGQDIEKKQVFVVKSYESSYESDISSLLIKGDIQTQLKDVFKVRTKLLKALEKDSGLKIKRTSLGKTVYELEPTIVKDFDFNEKDILSNLMELASYEPEIECSDIPYSVIFDDTVLKKIKDTKFQEGIRDFITSSDEIYSSFEYLEKGNLTLPKLKDLKKSLVKDAFFVKQNKVILSGQDAITNSEALEQHISNIETKIQQTPAYKAIENLLNDSKGIVLKDIIETNPEIIGFLALDKLQTCEKKDLSKSQEVCRTYDAIQSTYADILQNDNSIQEIRCNVLLDGLAEGAYTSDFVCVKADGDLMVRECIFRKFLTKPMTVKLLDASRDYWLKHGVSDWGIVIDEE